MWRTQRLGRGRQFLLPKQLSVVRGRRDAYFRSLIEEGDEASRTVLYFTHSVTAYKLAHSTEVFNLHFVAFLEERDYLCHWFVVINEVKEMVEVHEDWRYGSLGVEPVLLPLRNHAVDADAALAWYACTIITSEHTTVLETQRFTFTVLWFFSCRLHLVVSAPWLEIDGRVCIGAPENACKPWGSNSIRSTVRSPPAEIICAKNLFALSTFQIRPGAVGLVPTLFRTSSVTARDVRLPDQFCPHIQNTPELDLDSPTQHLYSLHLRQYRRRRLHHKPASFVAARAARPPSGMHPT